MNMHRNILLHLWVLIKVCNQSIDSGRNDVNELINNKDYIFLNESTSEEHKKSQLPLPSTFSHKKLLQKY